MEFTGPEVELVERGLADPSFRKMVEAECGWPIKVKIDWTLRTIEIRGPRSGRKLELDDFIAAQKHEESVSESAEGK